MELNIGMKHDQIVKLRDELTKAIDSNPEARDGKTRVALYGPGDGTEACSTLAITNDDMQRDEVADDQIYVEVSE